LPAGSTTSLAAKLNAASDAATRGNVPAACGEMLAFENEVQALVQSGRLDQANPRLFGSHSIASEPLPKEGRV
jgi:hypothetical protein